MARKRSADAKPASAAGTSARPGAAGAVSLPWLVWLPLLGALLLGAVVYAPAVRDSFFYDDADYVVGDPRLSDLGLFLPGGWGQIPPPLADEAGEARYLPAYQRPLIADRYLWRLSFALQRAALGPPVAFDSGAKPYYVFNLLLHLANVALLFFALRGWLKLLRPDLFGGSATGPSRLAELWLWLPGFAALCFAVQPWTSESVSYISARNGALGTFFVFAALLAWLPVLQPGRPLWQRLLAAAGTLLLCLCAYGSKENFVTAFAGVLLLSAPYVWQALGTRSRLWLLAALAGGTLLLLGIAALGIRYSDRAAGLWAQTAGGRGWEYLFTIQSPLVLQTLLDQLPGIRVSLETNHPGWSPGACWLALLLNLALFAGSLILGLKRPLFLGVAWFYLHLLPTNSFLPRPEFLAGRNVYLPAAGIAVLLAGALLAVLQFARERATPQRRWPLRAAWVLLAAVPLYWSWRTAGWAAAYTDGLAIWAQTVRIAPDHATSRANYANALLSRPGAMQNKETLAEVERQLGVALEADDSLTMRLHTERPKAVRRSVIYNAFALFRVQEQKYPEALQYLREAWRLNPTLGTWKTWLDTARSARDTASYEEAIATGLKHWPGSWWAQGVRGLRTIQSRTQPPWPESAIAEVRAVYDAPDSSRLELRELQMQACVAMMYIEPKRIPEFTERALRLGADRAILQQTVQRLLKQIPPSRLE